MDLDTPPTGNNINNTTTNNNAMRAPTMQQPTNNLNNMMTTTVSNQRSNYDTDVLRLIGQHLLGMGMTQTVNHLLEESGLHGVDHPLATEFQRYILAGDWDKASSLVEELINLVIATQQQQQHPLISMQQQQQQNTTTTSLNSNATPGSPLVTSLSAEVPSSSSTHGSLSNGHATRVAPATATTITTKTARLEAIRARSVQEIRLAIYEQKFLELIDDEQPLKALKCLQMELTPLSENVKKVQRLATLLMCKSNEEVRLKANWPGKGLQSRQLLFDRLSCYIPPPILLPPRRLQTLLEQAQQLQREHCILHIDQTMVPEHQASSNLGDTVESTGTTGASLTNNTTTTTTTTTTTSGMASTMNGCDANGSSSEVKIMNDGDTIEQTNGNCATSLASLAAASTSTTTSSSVTTNGTATNGANNATQLPHAQTGAGGAVDGTPATATTSSNRINGSRYYDLKQDHFCSADRFPLATRQTLYNHESEVWYCKFSNDGTKLATGGLGGRVKIWQLDPHKRELTEKCTLEMNDSYSVACLSWSPNDVYLLACGSDEQSNLWLWNVNKEELHSLIARQENEAPGESFTTCTWHLSGERFAAASIRGNMNIFDLDGNRCGSRDGVRVQCLAFLNKDPDYILASDTLDRIKMYTIKQMANETEEEDVLQERGPISSFTIDKDDRYLAVNLLEQGVHLWDFRLKILLRIFPGVLQRNTSIYSSFSSPRLPFLACGSEDGRVYIYHIHKDQPIAILEGHERSVNCVSWNPRYPELLVSVSDDRTVRLWGPIDKSEAALTTLALRTSATLGPSADSSSASRWIHEINYKSGIP